MLDYTDQPCRYCGEQTVIYHQYIAEECCESCGEWQNDSERSNPDYYDHKRAIERYDHLRHKLTPED